MDPYGPRPTSPPAAGRGPPRPRARARHPLQATQGGQSGAPGVECPSTGIGGESEGGGGGGAGVCAPVFIDPAAFAPAFAPPHHPALAGWIGAPGGGFQGRHRPARPPSGGWWRTGPPPWAGGEEAPGPPSGHDHFPPLGHMPPPRAASARRVLQPDAPLFTPGGARATAAARTPESDLRIEPLTAGSGPVSPWNAAKEMADAQCFGEGSPRAASAASGAASEAASSGSAPPSPPPRPYNANIPWGAPPAAGWGPPLPPAAFWVADPSGASFLAFADGGDPAGFMMVPAAVTVDGRLVLLVPAPSQEQWEEGGAWWGE